MRISSRTSVECAEKWKLGFPKMHEEIALIFYKKIHRKKLLLLKSKSCPKDKKILKNIDPVRICVQVVLQTTQEETWDEAVPWISYCVTCPKIMGSI